MPEITLEYLETVRKQYRANEQRCRDYQSNVELMPKGAIEKSSLMTMYQFQEYKVRGMAEAIDGIIFYMTGSFPSIEP